MNTSPAKPSMYCRKCQYVLDGLPESRCPECGTAFDPGDPKTWWPKPTKSWSERLVGWETIASLLCLALCVVTVPRGRVYWHSVGDYLIPIVFVAFGVGFALSACRRGDKLNRVVASMLLVLGVFLSWAVVAIDALAR